MASREPEKEESKEVAFWDVDEDIKPYGRNRLAKNQAEGKYMGIIKFLSDNGLLRKKRRAVNANGKLLIRQVFASDLTDEGISFVKAAHKPWFSSKTAAENPNNTALLEKYLKKLRG